ncbi:MAG: hypothetical protein PHF86_09590 [Candidatus Nanoarchaeia archaeon]|nr:hypothetical protein [Candidatus Nanoarchaeia archaeon]
MSKEFMEILCEFVNELETNGFDGPTDMFLTKKTFNKVNYELLASTKNKKKVSIIKSIQASSKTNVNIFGPDYTKNETPFKVGDKVYNSYWEQFGEIEYVNKDHTVDICLENGDIYYDQVLSETFHASDPCIKIFGVKPKK